MLLAWYTSLNPFLLLIFMCRYQIKHRNCWYFVFLILVQRQTGNKIIYGINKQCNTGLITSVNNMGMKINIKLVMSVYLELVIRNLLFSFRYELRDTRFGIRDTRCRLRDTRYGFQDSWCFYRHRSKLKRINTYCSSIIYVISDLTPYSLLSLLLLLSKSHILHPLSGIPNLVSRIPD